MDDPESFQKEHERRHSQYQTYGDMRVQCDHKAARPFDDQCPNEAEFEIEDARLCAQCLPLGVRALSRRGTSGRRPVIVRWIGK